MFPTKIPVGLDSSNDDAALFHFRDGVIDIAGLEFDTATGVGGEGHMEAFAEGIEGGEFDALAGGEAANGDAGDAAPAQPAGHAGAVATTVVVKAAVAVDFGEAAFQQFEDGLRGVVVADGHAFDEIEDVIGHEVVFVGLFGILWAEFGGGGLLVDDGERGMGWRLPLISGPVVPSQRSQWRRKFLSMPETGARPSAVSPSMVA